MTSKKYALLLYGQLRSYKLASSFLKDNFLNINDVDIFISTHEENKPFEYNFDYYYNNCVKGVSFIEQIDYSDLIEILKQKIPLVDNELYLQHEKEINNMKNLTDWKIWYKKIYGKYNKGNVQFNPNNYKYILHEMIMLYHRLVAFNLMTCYAKQQNIRYDGIIIYRPDLFFEEKLDLSNINISDESIYFRLEFMFVLSYKGAKILTNQLLNDYYEQKNTNNYINNYKKQKNSNEKTIKQWTYLSEWQHEFFINDKNNFKIPHNIFNCLRHNRAVSTNNHMKLYI